MTAPEQLQSWIDERGCTQTWLAGRLQVGRLAVRAWLIGDNKPDGPARAKLQNLCGIDAGAWDQE